MLAWPLVDANLAGPNATIAELRAEIAQLRQHEHTHEQTIADLQAEIQQLKGTTAGADFFC